MGVFIKDELNFFSEKTKIINRVDKFWNSFIKYNIMFYTQVYTQVICSLKEIVDIILVFR